MSDPCLTEASARSFRERLLFTPPAVYRLFELTSSRSTGKINCVIHSNHKTRSALPGNSAELLPAGAGNWATCLVY